MREPEIKPIRVMLVDDNRTVLWALEKLINAEKPRMEVVGQATSCVDAIDLTDKVLPDVIMLGNDLGEQNVIAAIPKLIGQSKAKVLVMAGRQNSSMLDNAIFAGATGVVNKEDPVESILKAIEKIHEGELWLDRTTTGRILVALSEAYNHSRKGPEKTQISRLTTREQELISKLAKAPRTSYGIIAEELHISEHTLRNHLTRIYSKLGVKNRLALFIYAQEHGLADPSA
ncbi:MAG: response regulator transcription factor [Gammaproteobacteria bacterium]|nr:response regulator transcription factor [Gammaproteobacteria bacterium]